ncbi:hypothetical protein VMCG_10686 [Cytospora schulzeri]|uniref:Major facilitator superfamily (MFS) profile domain-containing protein n=1 Tax=Cytospora schulzeri TaxID=448051 RepID=A0A423V9K8_9PEZI|nr:hypothetical protein VMCG_10686 [Valsa malicola]
MASIAANPSPLSWKETAPGIFTRPLDTIERFFKWLADVGVPLKREHWGVSLSLRLSLPDSIAAYDAEPYLRRAWLILSKQHPMLYARPEGHSVIVTPLNEDKWLTESFVTHSGEHMTVDSLFTTLGSTPVVTCHWLPGVRELLIHGSHWRLDGIGSLKLADRLLAALSAVIRVGVNAPLESYGIDLTPYFTPSLDEISNSYTHEESTPSAVKKVADNLLATILKGAPSIGLPLSPGAEKALPGPSSRVWVTLDKGITQKIVTACKTLGIQVTSAVHAAIVQAVSEHTQHPLAKHFCITAAIDLRRRLPGEDNRNRPELAAGMFVSPGLVFIEEPAAKGKGFDAIAREFNRTYAADMSRLYDAGDGETVSVFEATAPFARRIIPLLQMPQPEGLPPQNTPHLSSIGVIETYLKREYMVDSEKCTTLAVEDVWMGSEMITPAVCCHVWTWRDELTLAAVFNTAFYQEDFKMASLQSSSSATPVDGSASEKGEAPRLSHPAPGPPPNGGTKAWLQVLGAFFLNFNTWGLANSFGEFQTQYSTGLLNSSSQSAVSWIGSLQSFLMLVFGVVCGRAVDAGYFYWVITIGAFLEVFGMMMTSLATQYWQIILAQGIVVGLGAGMSFTSSITVVGTYFSTRRSTAMGLAATGSCLGGIIYPIVLRCLVRSEGLSLAWATRIMAFIMLATLSVSIALMRPRLPPRKSGPLVDMDSLRNPPFATWLCAVFFVFIGLYIPFFYVQNYALSIGVGTDLAFYMLIIMNAASIPGRIFPALLADKIGNLHIIIPSVLLSGVITLSWISVETQSSLIAISVFLGVFSGSIQGVVPALVPFLCPDLSKLGSNIGMTLSASGVGLLIGNPVAGAILGNQDGVWWGLWTFAGVTILLGFVLLCAVRFLKVGMAITKA